RRAAAPEPARGAEGVPAAALAITWVTRRQVILSGQQPDHWHREGANMADDILPQHRDLIERLTRHYQAEASTLAVIIGGSVAKHRARPDSDVDFMLIVEEYEYQRRCANRSDHIVTADLADLGLAPGSELEGKVFNWQFLAEAAERGSEPTRFSFVEAITTYSKLPRLADTMRAITTYPARERDAKIKS